MLCSLYICSEMKCPTVGKLSAHSSVMTSSRCLKHQCSPLIFFHLISKQMGRHLKGFERFCLSLPIKCSLVMDWYLHFKATEMFFWSRWKSWAEFQLTGRCLTGSKACTSRPEESLFLSQRLLWNIHAAESITECSVVRVCAEGPVWRILNYGPIRIWSFPPMGSL